LDPAKEVQAAEKRVALGISTKDAESIQHDGVPWIVKHRQRVREEQAERADGLAADPAAEQEAADQRQKDDQAQQQEQANAMAIALQEMRDQGVATAARLDAI